MCLLWKVGVGSEKNAILHRKHLSLFLPCYEVLHPEHQKTFHFCFLLNSLGIFGCILMFSPLMRHSNDLILHPHWLGGIASDIEHSKLTETGMPWLLLPSCMGRAPKTLDPTLCIMQLYNIRLLEPPCLINAHFYQTSRPQFVLHFSYSMLRYEWCYLSNFLQLDKTPPTATEDITPLFSYGYSPCCVTLKYKINGLYLFVPFYKCLCTGLQPLVSTHFIILWKSSWRLFRHVVHHDEHSAVFILLALRILM